MEGGFLTPLFPPGSKLAAQAFMTKASLTLTTNTLPAEERAGWEM